MIRRILTAALLWPLLFGCSADNATHPNDYIPVVGLEVTAGAVEIALSTSTRLAAVGTLKNGQTRDVTDEVSWQSSDNNIAFFDTAPGAENRLVGVSPGTVTVTGSFEELSDTAQVTVGDVSISSLVIKPQQAYLPVDASDQFSAIGKMSDSSEQDLTDDVNWFVTNPDGTDVASVSNADGTKGEVSGLAAGDATIKAVINDKTDDAALTVKGTAVTFFSVVPEDTDACRDGAVTVNSPCRYIANATFDGEEETAVNVSEQAIWSSSNSAVAKVSNGTGDSAGTVTGVQPGDSTIFAEYLDSKAGSPVSVKAVENLVVTSLKFDVQSVSMAKFTQIRVRVMAVFDNGAEQDYTITLLDNLTSDDENVVVLRPEAGDPQTFLRIFGQAAGEANLEVTHVNSLGTELTASLPVTVRDAVLTALRISPASLTFAAETTKAFQAIGTFSDGTEQVVSDDVLWTVGSGLQKVSPDYWIKGIAPVGESTVSIRSADGSLTAVAEVAVDDLTLNSLAITPLDSGILVGGEQSFSATGDFGDRVQDMTLDVSWQVSGSAKAEFRADSLERGRAQGNELGVALIEATYSGAAATEELTARTTLTME